ncbi:HD domain-containing protein [Cohnella sp. CFH 77786]|uniref:HD-GYP domain-containing protein n=1 Tax=Cohnella sp. CFH 77786 TaxID=2662265 RepID=UPI001C60E2D9|nr:HD-GYP domain-containing protein [Cohnella sp. CFH 77786]MBW5447355.1 HD domain-containing protein [Cohnella sp. CFH 77786]
MRKLLLGKKIKDDIRNETGLLLISGGTVLDQTHYELILKHQIDLSQIAVLSGEEITNLPEQAESNSSATALVQEATRYAKDLFERIKVKKQVPLLEIKSELIPVIQKVAEHTDLFYLFESVKAKDEYTHQHNIGVGVLSTLIGQWMNLNEKDVALLSISAFLHDVGKVRISEEILLKPDKLTKEEFEEIKQHTIYGYEILKETVGLNPRVALVALQHHEREDGSGYPLRLKGHQLDPLSRIVAVADVFHAMSSKRPYHEAMPFYELVKRMREGFFGKLDPHIVAVFLKNMFRTLVGRTVRLTDGRYGEVIYINPHEDTSPLVKVDQTYLDLTKERNIQISEILD